MNSNMGIQRKEEGRRLGEMTRREKSCHVGLVLLPFTVSRRGFSKKTSSEEGGYRVADILVHKQRTTQALCVHTQCVRSPAEERLKWRYCRQHGGAHPNLKRELCHGPVVQTFASTRDAQPTSRHFVC